MLTPKQQTFCEHYIACHNATQAAINAGYREHTAYSQGQRLLKNVEVKKRLDEMATKATIRRVASAQDVLDFLSNIMSSKEERTLDRLKAARMLADHYKLLDGVQQTDEKSQLDKLCDTITKAVKK
ncbi:MAG: terminase small subunit [Clostridiales bacterium]|nr:terminase small subunit [Clostridiales bacterium]